MSSVWIDGAFHDKLDAKIGVFDHGFLFGDGVVEDLRIRGGRTFRLAPHLDRLYKSAEKIGLEIPFDHAEMTRIIDEVIQVNQRSKQGLIRIIVTRGAGSLGLDPRKCAPCVLVMAEEMMPIPRELHDHGLELITSSYSIDPTWRGTLSRVDSVLAKAEAFRRGSFDAVTLNANGRVQGTIEGSIFTIKDDALRTPPVSDSGDEVIRADLINLIRELGLPVEECELRREDVLKADEAFLAGELIEVIAAIQLDGKAIGSGGPGPMVKRIRETYRALV